jgi:hypothetical protein
VFGQVGNKEIGDVGQFLKLWFPQGGVAKEAGKEDERLFHPLSPALSRTGEREIDLKLQVILVL